MIDPTTYSEWSYCVEIFEAGEQDDEVILAMSRGTLHWNSRVIELFSERISGAFNTRLKRCADRMERDLKSGGDETTVVRAMLETRRTLTLLHRVATIPSFPKMLREHLTGEIRKYAERAQQSLEDSAKHDRSGRLVSLIRSNSLLRYEPIPELATSTTPAPKSADVAQATVPVSEPAAAPSPSDVASASTVPRNAGRRWTFIALAAIVMCVVAIATWFSKRGKESIPVPVAVVAAPISTAAVSSPSRVAPRRARLLHKPPSLYPHLRYKSLFRPPQRRPRRIRKIASLRRPLQPREQRQRQCDRYHYRNR